MRSLIRMKEERQNLVLSPPFAQSCVVQSKFKNYLEILLEMVVPDPPILTPPKMQYNPGDMDSSGSRDYT